MSGIPIQLPPGSDPRPQWAQMLHALLREGARQGWRMRNTLEFDGPESHITPDKSAYMSIDPEDK